MDWQVTKSRQPSGSQISRCNNCISNQPKRDSRYLAILASGSIPSTESNRVFELSLRTRRKTKYRCDRYQRQIRAQMLVLLKAELMLSDWLKIIVWLGTYNHSSLFQHSIVWLIVNLFMTLAPNSTLVSSFTFSFAPISTERPNKASHKEWHVCSR